jgi:hypothetical protein
LAGEFTVTASADLGTLGARLGPAVKFAWTRPNIMPLLLPWLALLLLHGLKGNRGWSAWWVWVPFGVVAGMRGLAPALISISSQALDAFGEVFHALAFGLAVVWLLGHALGRGPRLARFGALFLLLGGSSLFAFGVRQDWSQRDTIAGLALLAIFSAVLAIALSLAGWICRRRYSPLRFSLWTLGWTALSLLLASSPFFILALSQSGHNLRQEAYFFASVFVVGGVLFLVLLPFLLLAFANCFYGERIRNLLVAPPPGDGAPPVVRP